MLTRVIPQNQQDESIPVLMTPQWPHQPIVLSAVGGAELPITLAVPFPLISHSVPRTSGLGGFNGFTKDFAEILGTTKFPCIHWEDCRARERLSQQELCPSTGAAVRCKLSTFPGRPFTRVKELTYRGFFPAITVFHIPIAKSPCFLSLYNTIF